MYLKNLFISTFIVAFVAAVGLSEASAQDHQMQSDRQDQGQAKITGEVLDSESDEGLAGIEVTIERKDQSGMSAADTQTEAQRDDAEEQDWGMAVEDRRSDDADTEANLDEDQRDHERDQTARDHSGMEQEGKKTAITDENGEFSVEGLEPGEYTVSVDAEGYEGNEETVEISEDDSEEEVEITLESTGNW